MTNYREILRLDSLGINHAQIARSTGHSRQTVLSVLKKAGAKGIGCREAAGMSDKELFQRFTDGGLAHLPYRMPDYGHVHKELARSGVTLGLLWVEYCEDCKRNGELHYQSTQFNKHYADYVRNTKATMHINRKPGEAMEVDWAGDRIGVQNPDTGEAMPAYVFVAALSYSGFSYVEAFFSMEMESWVRGHVNAYRHFGGVARLLVPDNLKTGVTANTRTETLINKNYQSLAEHYGTVVLPARVRAPQDKPKAEGTVRIVETWIMAALRNGQFFTLPELNAAIHSKLAEFNAKPFQKLEGSRQTKFLDEKPFLLPPPRHPFELSAWKAATVQKDYHVACQAQYYSVPHTYIGKKVEMRITKDIVEIFYEGLRIASHERQDGFQGKYNTREEHMPPAHRKYLEWDGDRFRRWARETGASTEAVVEHFLGSVKIEQQAYKACNALMHLADRHPRERIEAACARVLAFTARPSLKAVQSVLKAGVGKAPEAGGKADVGDALRHGFVRGAGYYGGNGGDGDDR